jgi:hypothetical protein
LHFLDDTYHLFGTENPFYLPISAAQTSVLFRYTEVTAILQQDSIPHAFLSDILPLKYKQNVSTDLMYSAGT